MARFDKSSTKRPRQDAAVAPGRRAKRSTAPSIEDTMFFPRLRRHAKWMFVFLAIALGGGFILFGVGAGGTGVGDIFRGGGGSAACLLSPRPRRRPRRARRTSRPGASSRPPCRRTDRQTGRSPRRSRSSCWRRRTRTRSANWPVSTWPRRTQSSRKLRSSRSRLRTRGRATDFPGAFTSPAGESLVNDAISVAIREQSSTKLQALVSAAQAASAAGVDAYRRVAVLSPGDPNVQLELAQTAQQAGDNATAIAAYKAFLKLAPDDANAPIVKQQLKQLAAPASG